MNRYVIKAQVQVSPYYKKKTGKYVKGYSQKRATAKAPEEPYRTTKKYKVKVAYTEFTVKGKQQVWTYRYVDAPDEKSAKESVLNYYKKNRPSIVSVEEQVPKAEAPKEIYGKLLTPAEETELATKYQKTGDVAARNKLVESNQRFVSKIAKEYSTKTGVDFGDLVQEGNLGLVEAIDKFDPKKGRLTTYADYWIRAYIRKFIGEEHERGQKEVSEWQNVAGKDEEEEVSRIEKIPSEDMSPEEEAAVNQARAQLGRIMPLLSDQERKVVQGVFWGDKSIEEIAGEMKLTRQRVNDIMLGAKAKLKKKLAGLHK